RVESARASKPAISSGDDEHTPWSAEIITADRPTEVNIDPGHEAFDTDRFNNRSNFPRVNFFPGSAASLSDEDYTVIWLPYAFRRPSEPTSIGLQAALFRYIQGGLYLRAETAPTEKLGAFEARQRYHLLQYGAGGEFIFSQNYDNERLADVSFG